MLPDEDGLQILRWVRERQPDLAVVTGLDRLEHRTMFTIDGYNLGPSFFGQIHHGLTSHDQRLFVGKGDPFAVFNGGEGTFQTGNAHNRGQHDIHIGIRGKSDERLRSHRNLRVGKQWKIEIRRDFGISRNDVSWGKFERLICQNVQP